MPEQITLAFNGQADLSTVIASLKHHCILCCPFQNYFTNVEKSTNVKA